MGAGREVPNRSASRRRSPMADSISRRDVLRGAGAGSSAAMQAAFLDNGPKMVHFVVNNSPLRFKWMDGYSDYYPELTGGMPNGRSMEPDMFDANLLGAEYAHLNPAYQAVPTGE